MGPALADRFRRWFEYECDAHAKVFASLETVPADRRQSPEFAKAVALMGHLVAARRLWLARLGAIPRPTDPLFPETAELPVVVQDWQQARAEWSRYLKDLDDGALEHVFDYHTYEGEPFRNRVDDVLTQLFTHSGYHRVQIATLVRAAGGEPAKTDYIFWCREKR